MAFSPESAACGLRERIAAGVRSCQLPARGGGGSKNVLHLRVRVFLAGAMLPRAVAVRTLLSQQAAALVPGLHAPMPAVRARV